MNFIATQGQMPHMDSSTPYYPETNAPKTLASTAPSAQSPLPSGNTADGSSSTPFEEQHTFDVGRARMALMDPDGSVDACALELGDVCFIPVAYLHRIGVLDDEKIFY
ncbi:hypothetical protein BDU57DRAFT_551355 [Ampelomyces quisqualis]|uniref:Cupin type-1 domain-containing protein n=1 Tax=Ampelomyces quisqualis TaxID=50730 RepID=A0A6A5QAI8_AMPQU|nr:hypothetical protein BDU57DRAFT_551355 [Ampelomyces quisqualis]